MGSPVKPVLSHARSLARPLPPLGPQGAGAALSTRGLVSQVLICHQDFPVKGRSVSLVDSFDLDMLGAFGVTAALCEFAVSRS